MRVGDRVVCVKSHSRGIVSKGKTYTVLQSRGCACGRVNLDVGVEIPSGHTEYQVCNVCGIMTIHNGIWWIASSLFAPLRFNSAHDELVNIVEEKIDVELPVRV